jgi:hypothetical protein
VYEKVCGRHGCAITERKDIDILATLEQWQIRGAHLVQEDSIRRAERTPLVFTHFKD